MPDKDRNPMALHHTDADTLSLFGEISLFNYKPSRHVTEVLDTWQRKLQQASRPMQMSTNMSFPPSL